MVDCDLRRYFVPPRPLPANQVGGSVASTKRYLHLGPLNLPCHLPPSFTTHNSSLWSHMTTHNNQRLWVSGFGLSPFESARLGRFRWPARSLRTHLATPETRRQKADLTMTTPSLAHLWFQAGNYRRNLRNWTMYPSNPGQGPEPRLCRSFCERKMKPALGVSHYLVTLVPSPRS